jgi:thiamine biosynthesis lipoprotein
VFDPAVLPDLERAGYDRSFEQVERTGDSPAPDGRRDDLSISHLRLDSQRRTVTAPPGLRIDLGGIGKGYAVDRMAELLEEWGLERVLVHGGFSSVLALEPPAGQEGWSLTLSDPRAPSRVLARLSARQMALGASGVRKGDHLVDPRTGEPARGRLAAWVAVPRPEAIRAGTSAEWARVAAAAVSDALTTAFMVLSLDAIEELCERVPGLEAWILPEPAGGPRGETPLLHFGGLAEQEPGSRLSG